MDMLMLMQALLEMKAAAIAIAMMIDVYNTTASHAPQLTIVYSKERQHAGNLI